MIPMGIGVDRGIRELTEVANAETAGMTKEGCVRD